MTTLDVAMRRGARLITANGIDIAYHDLGDGPPVVLLHGALISTGPRWAGSPVAHVDHFERLSKHFRVIAPDTRGSGATIHRSGNADFGVLTDDVIALIEALGLERPAVVGFSEGGATATLVTLRRPDLVSVLVNHAGFDYFDAHAPAHQGLGPIFGGGPGATHADPDAAERMFQSMGAPMSDTFARMQVDYDDAQGEGHWRTYLGQFFDRHIAPFGHSVDDLAALAVPTLVLTGDRDIFCSVEAACAVYRAVPDAELGIVPATGHEVSEAVIDLTIDFVRRRRARPA
ncbi:MAG TPA: alpha/beta hydrolase [Ilumatobacteraceae bacterium]